jgi:hypothetical protein
VSRHCRLAFRFAGKAGAGQDRGSLRTPWVSSTPGGNLGGLKTRSSFAFNDLSRPALTCHNPTESVFAHPADRPPDPMGPVRRDSVPESGGGGIRTHEGPKGPQRFSRPARRTVNPACRAK